MSNLLVLTHATEKNHFVNEWEESVKKNGFEYRILGLGTKWNGFFDKINSYSEELNKIPRDTIVILCDSYDLLFIGGPDEIFEKYNKLTPEKKIVISCDKVCPSFNVSCNQELMKCFTNTKSNKNFICSGFIIGPAYLLKKVHNYLIKESNENFINDDQFVWGDYMSKHCDEIIIDTNFDICLTYTIFVLSHKSMDKFIKLENNRIYNTKYKNYPSVVHMPMQNLYPDIRSEKIRNYFFPERKPVDHLEYFNGVLKFVKISKGESACIIIFPIVIVLFFFILLTRSFIAILYTIIFFGIILLIAYLVFLSLYDHS